MLLVIARGVAFAIGQKPDLQEMGGVDLRGVEFAVPDPRACRHDLDIAGTDHSPVADIVLVLQLAVQHIGKDLHVAVAMGAKAHAGLDAVFVDDPQRPEIHVVGVVITGKGEAVIAVEPAVIGMAACQRGAKGEGHGRPFSNNQIIEVLSGGQTG